MMDIAAAIKKALVVREEYKRYSLDGEAFPVSMETLAQVVAAYCQIEIEFHKVSFRSQHIKSQLLRYAKKAIIRFSSELNTCNQRFSATKEMVHLVIDTKDSHIDDCLKLVSNLIAPSLAAFIKNEDVQSEFIAEALAVELLMPFEIRARYIAEITAGRLTHFEVADKHKMPEYIVAKYLGAVYHTAIMTWMNAINQPVKAAANK